MSTLWWLHLIFGGGSKESTQPKEYVTTLQCGGHAAQKIHSEKNVFHNKG